MFVPLDKSPEGFARRAWCKLSLGNIATPALDWKETGCVARPANFDEVVRELTPFFEQAMRFAALHAERAERERLPEQLKLVLQRACDVVFEILMRTPESVDEWRAKLLTISPLLHAAVYPSTHG